MSSAEAPAVVRVPLTVGQHLTRFATRVILADVVLLGPLVLWGVADQVRARARRARG